VDLIELIYFGDGEKFNLLVLSQPDIGNLVELRAFGDVLGKKLIARI
jgi:hypothetical protein